MNGMPATRCAPLVAFFAAACLFLPTSCAAAPNHRAPAAAPGRPVHCEASAKELELKCYMKAQIAALQQERRALKKAEDELIERAQVMKMLQERQQALDREVLVFQRDLEGHIRRSLSPSPPFDWRESGTIAAGSSYMHGGEGVRVLTPVRGGGGGGGGGGGMDTQPLDERWAQYILLAAKSESWAARALAHALRCQSVAQSQDR